MWSDGIEAAAQIAEKKIYTMGTRKGPPAKKLDIV